MTFSGVKLIPLAVLLVLLALVLMASPTAAQGTSGSNPGALTAEYVDDSGVRLQWDAPQSQPESVTGYEIMRRLPLQGESLFSTLLSDTGNTDTSYTDTSAVTPGERYEYRVKAIRGSARSEPSNTASVDLPVADRDGTPNGAISLGDIAGLRDQVVHSGMVDGDADRIDYFVLELSQARTVGLGLGLMDRNADLFLEDSDGRVIQESRTVGTGDEAVSESLAPGFYYVRIEAQETGENSYEFTYEVAGHEQPSIVARNAGPTTTPKSITTPDSQYQSTSQGGAQSFEIPITPDSQSQSTSQAQGGAQPFVIEVDPSWLQTDENSTEILREDDVDLGDITDAGGPFHFNGSVDKAGDSEDWFSFTISSAQRVTLILRQQDSNADLVLEDIVGNELHASRDTGTGDDLIDETLEPGTYYLKVEAVGDGSNNYSLHYEAWPVDGAPADTQTELEEQSDQSSSTKSDVLGKQTGQPDTSGTTARSHGNNPSRRTGDIVVPSNPLDHTDPSDEVIRKRSGERRTQYIYEGNDIDYFLVSLNADYVYLITVRGSSEDPSLTLKHPRIVGIYDSDGHLIPYTSALGGGRGNADSRSAELLFDPQHSSGTEDYYIGVTGHDVVPYQGETGTYDLIVRSKRESDIAENSGYDWTFGHDTAYGNRPELAVGGTTSYGRIDFTNDWDYFTFPVRKGRNYTVAINTFGKQHSLRPAISWVYDLSSPDSDSDLHFQNIPGTGHLTYDNDDRIYHFSFKARHTGDYLFGITGANTWDLPQNWQKWTGPYAVNVVEGSNYTIPEPRADDCGSWRGTRCSIPGFPPGTRTQAVEGRSFNSQRNPGTINYNGDVDWFAVGLRAGFEYGFVLSGANPDPLDDLHLTLYGPDGRHLSPPVFYDGTGENSAEIHGFVPDADGIYYLAVKNASDTEVGNYFVSVFQSLDCSPDSGTKCAISRTSRPSPRVPSIETRGFGSAQGNISGDGDKDWFAVNLTAANQYQIDVKGDSGTEYGGTLPDPLVTLYGHDGSALSPAVTDDNSGEDNNASISHFAPATSGRYYIAVENAGGTGTGTYTIEVFEGFDCAADKNTQCRLRVNKPRRTSPEFVGGTTLARIGEPGDVDWIAVNLSSTLTYQIDVKGNTPDDLGGTLGDPYLAIYDSDGNPISTAVDDDAGEDINARLDSFSPPTTGTYYIAISSSSGSTIQPESGTYTVEVYRHRDCPRNKTTHCSVPVAHEGFADAKIDYPEDGVNEADVDWFAIDVYVNKQYTVYMQSRGQDGNHLPDPKILGIHNRIGERFASVIHNNETDGDDTREDFVRVEEFCTTDEDGDEDCVYIFLYRFSNEDSGLNRESSRILAVSSEDVSSQGPYRFYLAVGSQDGEAGAYSLWMTERDYDDARDEETQARDLARNYATEGVVMPGVPAKGIIDFPGDIDMWAIHVEKGEVYKLEVKGNCVTDHGGSLPNPAIGYEGLDDAGKCTNAATTFIRGEAGVFYQMVASEECSPQTNIRFVGTGLTYTQWVTEGIPSFSHIDVDCSNPTDTGSYTVELTNVSDEVTIPELNAVCCFEPGHMLIQEGLYEAQDAPFGDWSGSTYTRAHLRPHRSMVSSIGRAGDTDWYILDFRALLPVQGTGIELHAMGEATTDDWGSLADPVLTLYDSNGTTVLTSDDNSGDDNNASLRLNYSHLIGGELLTGRYWVEVKSKTASGTGSYVLRMANFGGFVFDHGNIHRIGGNDVEFRSFFGDPTPWPVPDISDGRNSPGRILVGGSVLGLIHDRDDSDWYRVQLDGSKDYTIDMKGESTTDDGGSLGDPIVRLYDETGSWLSTRDGGGTDNNARISDYTPPSSGTYFVEAVRGSQGAHTGTYTLSVTDTTGGMNRAQTCSNAGTSSVLVSFADATYSVIEGSTVTVTLNLSEALADDVDIPIRVAHRFGATSADHLSVPQSVTITAGATTASFDFTAVDDTDGDDGELVWLILCDLPDEVSHGDPARTAVSIVNTDDPGIVELGFALSNVLVNEGNSATVVVSLVQALNREVQVPLVVTGKGGATSGDYTISTTTLTFGLTDTSKEFTINAVDDTIDDDGESLLIEFGALPTGLEASGVFYHPELTVHLGDDDVPDVTVGFEDASQDVLEGTTARVPIKLSQAPERTVFVGVEVETLGAQPSQTTSLTALKFDPRTTTINASVPVAYDTPYTGLKLTLLSELFPAGVTAGTISETTLTIIEDDYPADSTTTGVLGTVDPSTLEGQLGFPQELAALTEVTGELELDGDRDWFRVHLGVDESYLIEVKGNNADNPGGTLEDPYVQLFDKDGNRVFRSEDDNTGKGNNARIVFNNADGGYVDQLPPRSLYFVQVRDPDGAGTGTYTLSVQPATDDYPASVSAPVLIPVDGQATGEIEVDGDRDWFWMNLDTEKWYRIGVNGVSSTDEDNTLADPELQIFFRKGKNIVPPVTNNDGGLGTNARRNWIAVGSGLGPSSPHIVEVRSHGNAGTGTYTVWVEGIDDYARERWSSGTVAVNGETTGNLEVDDDDDWFKVELKKGNAYLIEVKGDSSADNGGTLADPKLKLYPQLGSKALAQDDDSGEDNNALIRFFPEDSGPHWISVFSTSGKGTYTVAVTQTNDISADNQTTGSVPVGGEVIGVIDFPGDQDWFAVDLEAGKLYQLDAKSRTPDDGSSPPLADKLIGLYDSNGDFVGRIYIDSHGNLENPNSRVANGSAGEDDDARIGYQPGQTGTYFIAVSAVDGESTGAYTVAATLVEDPEDQDTSTTATLAVGGSEVGDINVIGDRDWFAVDLEAEKWYRASIRGATSRNPGGTLIRVLLVLFDTNGEFIYNHIDRSRGDPVNLDFARMTFKVDAAGTYYLEATKAMQAGSDFPFHRSNDGGTYTLSLEALDDHAEGVSTNSTIDVGTPVQGEIDILRDVDWLQVSLAADKWYRLEVKGDSTFDNGGTLADPFVKLYDTFGSTLTPTVEDDNSGVENNAQVTFKLDNYDPYYVVEGPFYIEVRSADPNEDGTYTLSIIEVVDDFSADTTTSGSVAVGEEATGTIDLVDDIDWISVQLEASTQYNITAKGAVPLDWGGTLPDPFIQLYDSTGTPLSPVVSDDNSGVGLNARLVFTPGTSDTFYIEIKSAAQDGVGSYTLSVAQPSADDFGADTTTTGTVAVGGQAEGEVERQGDTDWFSVALTANQWYRFDAKGASASAYGGTLPDPFVKLFDKHGDALSPAVEDDNSGTDTNARAFFRPSETETFYVEVKEADGTGTGTYTLEATLVSLDLTVLRVAAGAEHTCAILSDGATVCWGDDTEGQAAPPPGVTFEQISAGVGHTCGVDGDGLPHCWGNDDFGQSTASTSGVFENALAGWKHSCGLKTDMSVECWGSNDKNRATPPAHVYHYLSIGREDTCALADTDGDTVPDKSICWGRNHNDRHSPPVLMDIIADGHDHGCGIRWTGAHDGEAECWGKDYNNKLLPRPGTFIAMGSGETNTCAIKTDGSIRCFSSDTTEPVYNPPSGTFKDLSYTDNHVCAITTYDKLVCWGEDDHGKAMPPLELQYHTLVLFRPGSYTVSEGGSVSVTVDLIGRYATGTVWVGETLRADTSGISDSNGLNNVQYTYQWIRRDGSTDTPITGASGPTYVPTSDDLGKAIKVSVTFTDDHGYAETLTSPPTGNVTRPPNEPPTGQPTISGTVREKETLRADTSGIVDFNGLTHVQYSYQWIRSDGGMDSNITGATGSTYVLTPDDAGKTIKVQVSFTDDHGYAESVTSASTRQVTRVRNQPAVGALTITGTVEVGETLSADTSDIHDFNELTNVQYSYQWIRRDGNTDTPIIGATSSTYVLTSDDLGKAIKVSVSFTDDSGYPEMLTSVATGNVASSSNVDASGQPTITGTAREGETLGVDISGISDSNGLTNVQYTYQWIRSDGGTDTDITGATGSTYVLTSDDTGKSIKVRVSFTDDSGYSETLTSPATGSVERPPNEAPAGQPIIAFAGTVQVGKALSADTSTISDGNGLDNVQYSYQWMHSDGNTDTPIIGATSSTYVLTSADLGKAIKVSVSFTDDDGYPEMLTSAATGNVTSGSNAAATGQPAISSLTLLINATGLNGATSADYTVDASAEFAVGASSMTLEFSAATDTDADPGESVLLSFGTLPTGMGLANPSEIEIAITDGEGGNNNKSVPENLPESTVSFEEASYTVGEGSSVTVKVKLSASPERTTIIPITATGQSGATASDYSVPTSVVFNSGDTEKKLSFAATDDAVDDDGESVKLTFGQLPNGVTEGTTNETTVSITDDDEPPVTVSFEESSYTVAEGSSVAVKVVLSADPERTVTIPITATGQGGATASDYSVPTSVEFNSGDTERTFSFAATGDEVVDGGESVRLGFGTLPAGVSEGTPNETTVSITEDDLPSVTVSFEESSYTVAEGSSVAVKVKLSADPGRTVTIPITAAGQDGATASDYSDPASVEFNSGDTEKTFSFAATDDEVDDGGESVRLGFGTLPAGVSEGTPNETTVSITEDDLPSVTVSFEEPSYAVAEGSSVMVKVKLSADPERTINVPLTATGQGGATSSDYSVPTSVVFNSGDTEKTFSFAATDDEVDDDGESVGLGFDTLPAGVSEGTTNETTVSITDDDVPPVTVSYEESSYTVDEGGSVTVKVKLSADPERTVIIPISSTHQGGASTADYSGVPPSVEFNSGDTEKTFDFSATADEEGENDESVKLAFGQLPDGVTEGTTNETELSIIDSDGGGEGGDGVVPKDDEITVSYEESSYAVAEGSSVTVKVKLSADPERTVTIPLTATGQGGATASDYSVPSSVVFNSGDTEKTFSFASTDDEIDDDGESVRLGFDTLPAGVSEGTTNETTVSITDDDVPPVTVSFEESSYTVGEGSRVTVKVKLSADPERTVTIPITATGQGGATTSDYSVPTSVVFNSGDTEKTFSFAATDDEVDDDGESVRLGFDTLPAGVSEGTTNETTVSITDNDVPPVTVSFEESSYAVDEGDSVMVKVKLSADPERTITVPLTATGQGGATASDYSVPTSVVFNSGDTEKTFSFAATDDEVNDGGESVRLGFDTLPAGVSEGTTGETTVSITDDDGVLIASDPDARHYDGSPPTGTAVVLLRRQADNPSKAELRVDWTHDGCTGEGDWFSVALTRNGGTHHVGWIMGDPELYREIRDGIIGYDPVPGQTEYTTGWDALGHGYDRLRQSDLDMAVRVQCNKGEQSTERDELVALINLEDPGTPLGGDQTEESDPEPEPGSAEIILDLLEDGTVKIYFVHLPEPPSSGLVYRADVVDSQGNDADGCEGSGMGSEEYIHMVDEEPEVRTVELGTDCAPGEYAVQVSLAGEGGTELATATMTFEVE